MASTSHRYTKVETINLPPLTTTRKLTVNTQKSSRPPIPQRNSAISIPSAECCKYYLGGRQTKCTRSLSQVVHVSIADSWKSAPLENIVLVILEHPGQGRRFSDAIQVLPSSTPPNNTPPGTNSERQFPLRRPFIIYRASSSLISPLSHGFMATALLIANVSQVRNFLNTPHDEHSFWDYVIWGLCVAISLQILAAILLILSYISYLKCGEQRELVVPNFRQSPTRCFKLARGLESIYLVLAFLIMALNIFTALFIENDDNAMDRGGELDVHSLFYPTTASPVTQKLTTTSSMSWEAFPTAKPFWIASTPMRTDDTTTNILATVSYDDIQEK